MPDDVSLRICLLGKFKLLLGRRPVDDARWERPRARRLVQLLAVQPDYRLHREVLAEILFPERNPEHANASLSRILYLARRALQPDLQAHGRPLFLAQSGGAIQLASGDVQLWIDSESFASKAESGLGMNDPDALRQAAAEYTGDLLCDLPFEQWAIGPRERLKDLYLRVLRRLAEIEEASARTNQAHHWLDRILAIDMTDEGAHRAKMRLFASDNRRTAALKQYESLRSHLWSEFEIRPEEETNRLLHDIKNPSPSAGPLVNTDPKTEIAQLEADQAYFKGVYLFNKRTVESLFLSIKYFRQASTIYPRMAAAYIGLANAYNLLGGFYGAMPTGLAQKRVAEAVHKALRIDESLFEARLSLAYSHFTEWKLGQCAREFAEILSADPGDTLMRQWYLGFLTYTGEHREAILEAQKFPDLSHSTLSSMNAVGHAYYHAGDLVTAAAKYREVLELEDSFAKAHLYLGHTLREQGRLDDAIREFRKAVGLTSGMQEKAALAHALALRGESRSAECILKRMTAKQGRQYVSPYYTATVLIGLNRKDEALACLEQGIEDRAGCLVFMITDPLFEPLGKHRRYQKVLSVLRRNE